jgi:hypothetical protein
MQSNYGRQVNLQTLYSLPKPYKYTPLDWDAAVVRLTYKLDILLA